MSRNRIQPAQPEHYPVPIAGAWQPGQLLPKPQPGETVQMLNVPISLMPRGQVAGVYAVQVHGNAPDMLVADKDMLLVRETTEWNDGQTLLLRVVGEDGLLGAQLWHEGNQIRLQPTQGNAWVRHLSADEIVVDALVVGIVRIMTE